MSGETMPTSTHEYSEEGAEERLVDEEKVPHDHPINVELRAIQDVTVEQMRDEFGDTAETFALDESWEKWPIILNAPDIIEEFKRQYAEFVKAHAAELRGQQDGEHRFDLAA